MITEKKFMLISIRDNKLKVKVDQYDYRKEIHADLHTR